MMKVNVIKAKDKYTQSCSSLDWYDHISGMSARDIEIEMEYVCEQVTSEMLEMLNKINDFIQENKSKNYMIELLNREVPNLEQLIKEATEL